MYVCMYIYIYASSLMYVLNLTRAFNDYINKELDKQRATYIDFYNKFIYIYIYTHTHIYIYTFTYICIYTYIMKCEWMSRAI